MSNEEQIAPTTEHQLGPIPHHRAKICIRVGVGRIETVLGRWAVAAVARALELLQVRAAVTFVHEQRVARMPTQASGRRAASAVAKIQLTLESFKFL